MTYFIIFLLANILTWVGLYKVFQKAGVTPWKAFVPILNWFEWLKLIGKPTWWIVLLFIPLVNIFYYAYMLIGLSKSFKHYGFFHHAAAVLLPFFYVPYLGFHPDEQYYGVDGLRPGEHLPEVSGTRSWVDSIIFAIIAAHLIRMFLIEAYKIPTSSMEPTLQIGDFMFVSKVHYGSRVPMTPLSLPLIHHTIPKTKWRAYSELIKLPYYRLPGFETIERNDIAVFNVPFEHDMKGEMSRRYYPNLAYDSRPVDKREHYIKRIVGMPGDQLQIKENQLYIDDSQAENPDDIQFHYIARMNRELSKGEWRDLGVRSYNNYFNGSQNPAPIGANAVQIDMRPNTYEQLKDNPAIDTIVMPDYTKSKRKFYAEFPSDAQQKSWTIQDYGPITIPKEGMTIDLTKENFETYREAITIHEGNDAEWKDDQLLINGQPTNQYTFHMNYYFMMGDNRHSSLDSRSWGFVPEDHIVGKPLFIFFSSQGGQGNPGVRWNRILKKAQDMN